jgi:hypothetical protein
VTPPAVGVAFDGTGVGLPVGVGVGTGVGAGGVCVAEGLGVAFPVAFGVAFDVLPVVGATTGVPDVPGAEEVTGGVDPAGRELVPPADDTGALAPELTAATSADAVGLVCFDELVQPVSPTATTTPTARPANRPEPGNRERDDRRSLR